MLIDRLEQFNGKQNGWLKWALLLLVVVTMGLFSVFIYKRVSLKWEEKRLQQIRLEELKLAQIAESNFWNEIEKLVIENPVAAREKCYEFLSNSNDKVKIARLEDIIGRVNISILFSPMPAPEKVEYIVQSGDSLEKIAKKFKTTIEVVQKGNNIKGATLHPGDRLRIPQGVFTLHISKSRNDLEVRFNDKFFKRYKVGTGKFGTTPTGTFVISDRIVNPVWWRPDGKMIPFGDKENLLGTRWLALTAVEGTAPVKGYGIHGTWEPETIGKQSSMGCIRLLNSDVEELFQFIPIGCKVFITE